MTTTLEPILVCCAWCSRVIRDGVEPASHGICPDCLTKYFPFQNNDRPAGLSSGKQGPTGQEVPV